MTSFSKQLSQLTNDELYLKKNSWKEKREINEEYLVRKEYRGSMFYTILKTERSTIDFNLNKINREINSRKKKKSEPEVQKYRFFCLPRCKLILCAAKKARGLMLTLSRGY